MGSGSSGVLGVGVLGGWVEGDDKLRMPLMQLVFPTSIGKVIFFIFMELVFLEKLFSKRFDNQNNIGKLENCNDSKFFFYINKNK